jgi:hypothetical protein
MHIDIVMVGGWCLAVLAIVGVLGLIFKGVRLLFRNLRRAGKFFDQWFGDRESGIPSMPERMAATTQTLSQLADTLTQQGHRLDEHLTWHSAGDRTNGGVPAGTPRPQRS